MGVPRLALFPKPLNCCALCGRRLEAPCLGPIRAEYLPHDPRRRCPLRAASGPLAHQLSCGPQFFRFLFCLLVHAIKLAGGNMESHKLLRLIRTAVLLVVGVVWVASMFTQTVLDNTYVTYPRAPDAASQRTMPYVPRHVVVYITSEQKAVLDWLRWLEISSGALVLISLVLNQKWPLSNK
jgi:hypothetical protein